MALPRVMEQLLPHPVRYRQVWGQEWKHTAVYAWAAVPPPGRGLHSSTSQLNLSRF